MVLDSLFVLLGTRSDGNLFSKFLEFSPQNTWIQLMQSQKNELQKNFEQILIW